MALHNTTPTPNVFFDSLLPILNPSELKVLLVIIRQTYGWVDSKNGGRKTRDRITIGYFKNKTGLSRKSITQAISSLIRKGLITATTKDGSLLASSSMRKGKWCIYYTCCLQQASIGSKTSVVITPKPVTKLHITKETLTKETLPLQAIKLTHSAPVRLTDLERYQQIIKRRTDSNN